jgi:hypothetical protein
MDEELLHNTKRQFFKITDMGLNPIVVLARADEIEPNVRADPMGEHVEIENQRVAAAQAFGVPLSRVHISVPYLTETKRGFDLERQAYVLLDTALQAAVEFKTLGAHFQQLLQPAGIMILQSDGEVYRIERAAEKLAAEKLAAEHQARQHAAGKLAEEQAAGMAEQAKQAAVARKQIIDAEAKYNELYAFLQGRQAEQARIDSIMEVDQQAAAAEKLAAKAELVAKDEVLASAAASAAAAALEHAALVGDLLDQIGRSEAREKAHLETIRIQQEESESAAELVSSNSKFITPALILGKPVEIAYGLKELLGVNSQTVGGYLIDAMSAIRAECEAVGLEEDKQNLQHILAGTQNGGWEATKSIDELLAHSSSKLAHLEKHHVVALRMYTSSSFKTINDSLRKRVKPHPLPATTYFISEALKLLNAVSANQPDANMSKHLWRGMKNLKLSFEFLMQGGTELACLSTSESEDIAFKTFADSECPLLFRIVSKDFNTHGASIDFLSVYPSEKEILYPPLTFMRCLGTTRKEVKNAQGQMMAVLVAEVELVLA